VKLLEEGPRRAWDAFAPRPHRQMRARFFVGRNGVAVEKARPLTTTQRRAIFKRDGYRCQYCGVGVTWTRWESRDMLCDTKPGHVDHVFARARGGQNDPENLALACERCNESKQASSRYDG
jgi:5-methylcytosine-specific restriction endonuclease McrA